MLGPSRSSAELDVRRRRILFRAWHRGTREMDLIMGSFCDSEIAGLGDGELDELERLIDVPDQDLYAWITGSDQVDETFDTALLARIRTFQLHSTHGTR
jgi:antitoxin CptB